MNWLVFCSRGSVAAFEPRALSALVMSVEHNNDYALQFSVEIRMSRATCILSCTATTLSLPWYWRYDV
jgi:hypothetical protein